MDSSTKFFSIGHTYTNVPISCSVGPMPMAMGIVAAVENM